MLMLSPIFVPFPKKSSLSFSHLIVAEIMISSKKSKKNNASGFTVLEIMIIVVILSLLMSLGIVAYQQNRIKVLAFRFGQDSRVFRNALEQCVAETGDYDLGASAGQLSTTFEPYVRKAQWAAESPLGGHWMVQSNRDGIKLCLGLVGITASEKVLALADRLYDDGNIGSGDLIVQSPTEAFWIVEK